MSGKSGVVWFLLGLIVGATAALMLAPQRGVEFREQIAETASSEWSRALDEMRKAREALEDAREEMLEAEDELDEATAGATEAGEES